jgi:hypothetical protein
MVVTVGMYPQSMQHPTAWLLAKNPYITQLRPNLPLDYNGPSFRGWHVARFDGVIGQLREERARVVSRLEGLDRAIAVLDGSTLTRRSGRRTISAAGRRRIAEAQRKRWALIKGGARKRTLSPAARRRIVAAQKARWARFRAEKKK